MRCAEIGSVSSGTLVPADLVESFWNELEYQLGRQERVPGTDECVELDKIRESVLGRLQDELWDENGDLINDAEALDYAIEDLTDALNVFAPPFCYFGSHCGGVADFGFWPDMDSIESLPRYSSHEEAEADAPSVPGESRDEYAIVNDHGNVAVYSAAGEMLIDFV